MPLKSCPQSRPEADANDNAAELDWTEIIEKYVSVQKSFRRYLTSLMEDGDQVFYDSDFKFRLWVSKLDEAEDVIDTLVSAQQSGKERLKH